MIFNFNIYRFIIFKRFLILLFISLMFLALLFSGPLSLVLEAELVYHGNVQSKIYHAPSCRYYYCKNCVKKIKSAEEGYKLGYRACKICL